MPGSGRRASLYSERLILDISLSVVKWLLIGRQSQYSKRVKMANECCEARSEQQRVMDLFKSGKSKAEIGRVIGKDKKAVGKILAQAIRGMGNAA